MSAPTNGVIGWAAGNPLVVALLTVFWVVLGAVAYQRLPVDAVPDVTNVQVQVVTRAPALSATEVETEVTQPIERTMAGLPGLKEMRSTTKLGIVIVTLVFRDDVDVYFARTLVSERLAAVRALVPDEVGRPELGPVSTGLGEIFMFELRGDGARTHEELRTLVDWQIAPRLRQVPGVIDVVGMGGDVKQYRVTLDPARLTAHGASIEEVRAALERDNAVSGGGYVERAGEQVVLRGDARFRSLEDIAATVVRAEDHTPLRVGQLGEVDTGAALRQGAMSRDARGEVVGASVWMLKGENSRDVVARVKAALSEVQKKLPAGVSIEPYYDRAEFIDRVLATVQRNLAEGALLVVACLLLTLGSVRAGLLVAGAIPFSMLTAFIGLGAMGLGGNVMSLGAVDFGIVVEGAVVVVEHVLTRLGPRRSGVDRERRARAMVGAMAEVARPVVFGVVIVTLVFLPLTTLEDVEGKMFRPVVYSLVFMLMGALFYALIIVPAVAPRLFADVPEPKEPLLARVLAQMYAPAARLALRRPFAVLASTFGAAAILLAVSSSTGAEFLPRIFEGSFALDARRPPSVSLTQALDLGKETETALREIPEVKTVVNRIGRPEGAVDPSGPESSDVFVILKPRDAWRPGVTPESLVEEMSKKLEPRVPATIHAFSQPIEMRVNDLIAGVKSDVAIKVFGEDLDDMTAAAEKIRRAIQEVPGAADVKMEIATGLPSIKVAVARDRAARLGVAPRAVLDAVAMTRAGESVGAVREGERVFDLVLRVGGDTVDDGEDLARLPIATADQKLVPLSLVADVKSESTVVQISREQMRRRLVVEANIRGRDLVGFVDEARTKVETLDLPRGVDLVWGGQFQNFHRAKTRLTLLVPVALGVISLMLVLAFRSVRYMFVTVASLPFAVAGGAIALVFRGLPFSIPAGVGFIALAGVSVMNGVVMTTKLASQPAELPLRERVERAARASLRPIASTALVAAIGFVPMAIATGPGAEVQRPLATVVIGGLALAMLFSLPALPAMLYVVTRSRPLCTEPR